VATEGEVRLAIIGDSTVCNYPSNSVTRGWGEFIQPAFKEQVRVINLAKSGRSTKTFIKEGLWKKTLETKPQFILIQFGHNDSHAKERPEATAADGDFKENLRRYIAEARAAGAQPVFITPVHRRMFKADGTLSTELQPYAETMKQVAAELKVPLVDLYAMSGELFLKAGDTGGVDLNCKPSDRTHFSAKGAKAVAGLVLKELPAAAPELKPLLKD
jgi:lysophospholipase L1-like esterase